MIKFIKELKEVWSMPKFIIMMIIVGMCFSTAIISIVALCIGHESIYSTALIITNISGYGGSVLVWLIK